MWSKLDELDCLLVNYLSNLNVKKQLFTEMLHGHNGVMIIAVVHFQNKCYKSILNVCILLSSFHLSFKRKQITDVVWNILVMVCRYILSPFFALFIKHWLSEIFDCIFSLDSSPELKAYRWATAMAIYFMWETQNFHTKNTTTSTDCVIIGQFCQDKTIDTQIDDLKGYIWSNFKTLLQIFS